VSDASHLILYDDKRRLWPQRGIYTSTTFRDKPKYLESCRVWGAVGLGFRSKLVLVEGTVKAADYQHMLEES
jgi:hypothetical protein